MNRLPAHCAPLLTFLSVIAFTTVSTSADVLRVEADGTGDYPTIQTAMDAANAGDTVLLGPGTYTDTVTRNLNGYSATSIVFMRSGVTLEGEQGPETTILDGQSHHHCIAGEDLNSSTTIRGVTVLNGLPNGSSGNGAWGGGILTYYASVLVENCYFFGCHATGGGGILFYRGGPTSFRGSTGPIVRSCFFDGNTSGDLGAGIETYKVDVVIEGNTFVRNHADDSGGAVLLNDSSGHVDKNIFWDNTAGQGAGGVGCINGAGPLVLGSCNVFWENGGPSPDVRDCTVLLGQDGNVLADPLFCDVEGGDFRLQADSPGAPDNSGGCGLIGAFPVNCGPPSDGGLSIPELGAQAGTEVVVPVLFEAGAAGAYSSYQVEISYDPDILSFDRTEVAGTLSDGMLVAGNETVPGTLLIAAAGTELIVGPGVLLDMVLLVSPATPDGQRSPVAFESFSWDENVPPVSLEDGGVTVGDPLTVGGRTLYYSVAERPIPGVVLDLAGDLVDSAVSDSAGEYGFSGLWQGATVSVTPSFADESVDAVSALDASLVLQHLVQSDTLDANQILAADLTEDGTVSPEDASRILQMVVGGPIPDPLWLFVPEAIEIDSLETSQADLDFAGILRGDVTGNWCPTAPCPTDRSRNEFAWSLSGEWRDRFYELTLRVEEAGALGLDFVLTYDPRRLRFGGLEALGGGLWESAEASGRIAVAGATGEPWAGGEAGVVFRFGSELTPARLSEIVITSLRIDEGPPQEGESEVPGILPPRDGVWVFDLRISPNPARRDVALEIRGATELVQIDVFDVTGRRVRALGVQPDATGSGSATWDRRDGTGSLVADGIYFVRARSSAGTAMERVLLMR